jgi:hypothetical protein
MSLLDAAWQSLAKVATAVTSDKYFRLNGEPV